MVFSIVELEMCVSAEQSMLDRVRKGVWRDARQE